MMSTGESPGNAVKVSVILCTYNRAALLKMALESLVSQTLSQRDFEVIVIDDGSKDETRKVVDGFANQLPLRYFFQENAGLAAAKNHGIYAASGEIVFFFDDDDLATPTLLEEHLRSHQRYPDENFAVLNYTDWAPSLTVTPLMEFVTDVGFFMFYYPSLRNGDIVDYTYFWGGRSSCKRGFLIKHGVFDPVFRFGCEDIELGYRLSKQNLKVVYNKDAVSLMARPVTFDGFCSRLIRQGRSQNTFYALHPVPEIRSWAEIDQAAEHWTRIEPVFDAKLRSARELDRIANEKLLRDLPQDHQVLSLLHRAYWWIFKACKIRGIVEAADEVEKRSSI